MAGLALLIHLPFLAERPFFAHDDFGWLADAVNLSKGSTGFFELPAWGVWRLGQRATTWALYEFFGLDPGPYHALNVLLHAVTSGLVACLALRLGLDRLRAGWCGALFAGFAHPSFTVRYPATVAVIAATALTLAAALCHLGRRPFLAAVALLLGAAFYEQALAAPLVLLVLNRATGRRVLDGLPVPALAALAFFALNAWTLRHEAKVFAYNPGGLSALRQAFLAPAASAGLTGPVGAVALGIAIAAGIVRRLPRPGLAGLALAWAMVAPLLGRNLEWPWWYFYAPAVGAALTIAAATPRGSAGSLLLAVVLLIQVVRQPALAEAYLSDARRYEEVTRETSIVPGASAAVLLNVHSGLAWTGWQFGATLRRFELWDAPGAPSRCYAGSDLPELRARLRREHPGARLRSRFPEDLPAAMRITRTPARHHLVPWPDAASPSG